jgi:hypothetical protein
VRVCRVPPTHPSHGKHYDDLGVTVHGGLTFGEIEPCSDHEDGQGSGLASTVHTGTMPPRIYMLSARNSARQPCESSMQGAAMGSAGITGCNQRLRQRRSVLPNS